MYLLINSISVHIMIHLISIPFAEIKHLSCDTVLAGIEFTFSFKYFFLFYFHFLLLKLFFFTF